MIDVRAETIDSGRAPPHPELTGRNVGPYLLEERLGSGGMGTVYRAVHGETQQRVALKVLFPELAAVPDVRARFVREGMALEAVNHAGVVRAIASGSDGDFTYLAMELVEGESLEAALQRGVDVREVPRLIVAIADALSAAHAAGIVHRDLKPANVLLARDGAVKLVDFGVARFETPDGTLTHTDAVLGTFNYMAPEQRLRARAVDHRADLFALGVIVYRALTGTLPIGAYEKPSAVNRSVPRAYDTIVARLLATDPQKRFQDARAVAEAFTPRPRLRTITLSATAAILLAATATFIAWPNPTTPPSAEPPPAIPSEVSAPSLAKSAQNVAPPNAEPAQAAALANAGPTQAVQAATPSNAEPVQAPTPSKAESVQAAARPNAESAKALAPGIAEKKLKLEAQMRAKADNRSSESPLPKEKPKGAAPVAQDNTPVSKTPRVLPKSRPQKLEKDASFP